MLKSCKDHHYYKTGRYKQLYDRLKHRTLPDISDCKYHNSCSRNLSRDEKYITRAQKIKKSSEQENKLTSKSDRISRSSMSFYDKEKCFFCQDDTSESIHQVSQFSKNDELKTAFQDSPVSLGVYKIRYEWSSDATAGDLKYHTSCWRNIIFKRVKEYDLSPESSMSTVSVDTVETSLQETERKSTTIIMEPMYYVILTDIASGVIESLANNNILSIRDVV